MCHFSDGLEMNDLASVANGEICTDTHKCQLTVALWLSLSLVGGCIQYRFTAKETDSDSNDDEDGEDEIELISGRRSSRGAFGEKYRERRLSELRKSVKEKARALSGSGNSRV